jgi:hypothetical protein
MTRLDLWRPLIGLLFLSFAAAGAATDLEPFPFPVFEDLAVLQNIARRVQPSKLMSKSKSLC